MFFFSSRRRHTRFDCDWSSDVCSSDLEANRSPFARMFRLCLAKTRSACEMNDIRGGRITRQVPGSSNLVKALKAANEGINHVQRLSFHSNGAFTTLLSDIPKTVSVQLRSNSRAR